MPYDFMWTFKQWLVLICAMKCNIEICYKCVSGTSLQNRSEVFFSIDAYVGSSSGGALIAARVVNGGCRTHNTGGLFFFIYANGSFSVTSNICECFGLVVSLVFSGAWHIKLHDSEVGHWLYYYFLFFFF